MSRFSCPGHGTSFGPPDDEEEGPWDRIITQLIAEEWGRKLD